MNILLLFSYDYDFSHLPFYVDGIVGFQLVYFIDFYDKRGHASYICIKRCCIVLFTDNCRSITKEKIKNWRMIHMLYKFDIFNYYGTMQLLKKFIKFILRTLHNKWNINKLMNETCNQEIIMYFYMYVCISKYNN